MRRIAVPIFALLLSSQLSWSAWAQEDPGNVRMMVHLLDYLAKDYGGAVGENGAILNRAEYDEQLEFATALLTESQQVKGLSSDTKVQLGKLRELISKRKSPSIVAPAAKSIQASMIASTGLELYPKTWPSLEAGEKLYAQNCLTCHGTTGAGDGPVARGLEPKPANFLNEAFGAAASPFASYNAIRLGVPGTAMQPFNLSDDQIWALAFYVVSLRHQTTRGDLPHSWSTDHPDTIKRVATQSDRTLYENLPGSAEEKARFLSLLRKHSGDSSDSLRLAQLKLEEGLRAYESGSLDFARKLILEAYLEGIEPLEPKIRANDQAMVIEIENSMTLVRSSIEAKRPVMEVKERVGVALQKLQEAKPLLKEKSISPWLSFLGASAVVLREGFEAVLIIIALLGLIRATGHVAAAKWVHAGWIAAVGVGGLAWIFSGWLMKMSGADREVLEGATSLVAIVILLYVGFWLHSRTEITRWKAFLESQIKDHLNSKKLLGLAMISFVAVFREALETVLFLRAIWLDTESVGRYSLGVGVVTSLFLVLVLSWISLFYSKRLPLSKLFTMSSMMMLGLSTILAGKAIHAFQEAGWVGVTVFPIHFRVDLFGIYPTIETMVIQLATFLLALSLWLYGKRPSVAAARST